MKKFKYNLSIDGSRKELESLQKEFIQLGYKGEKTYCGKSIGKLYLINTFGPQIGCVAIVDGDIYGYDTDPNRIRLNASERNLILALAAMVDDDKYYEGEWVKVIDKKSIRSREVFGELVKIELVKRSYLIDINDKTGSSGKGGMWYDDVRKATKEEIFSHFRQKHTPNIGDIVFVINGGNGALGAIGHVGRVIDDPYEKGVTPMNISGWGPNAGLYIESPEKYVSIFANTKSDTTIYALAPDKFEVREATKEEKETFNENMNMIEKQEKKDKRLAVIVNTPVERDTVIEYFGHKYLTKNWGYPFVVFTDVGYWADVSGAKKSAFNNVIEFKEFEKTYLKKKTINGFAVQGDDWNSIDKDIIGYKLKSSYNGMPLKDVTNWLNLYHVNINGEICDFEVKSKVHERIFALNLMHFFEPVFKKKETGFTIEHGVHPVKEVLEVKITKNGIFVNGNYMNIPGLRTIVGADFPGTKEYNFKISHVNIGCKKAIKVEDIKRALEEYDKLNG